MDEHESCDEERPTHADPEVDEEEDFPLQSEDELFMKHNSRLVLVKGPLFDFCSASITIIISFAVVINYLVISERVKLKDLPYATKHEEIVFAVDHQRSFYFPNAEISSVFDSGNARSAIQNAPYEFEIKVGGESQAKTRRWFYFTVDNLHQPVTMMFFVSNLTLDSEMLTNGAVPVFKSDSSAGIWAKLEYVTRIRQIDTNEMEIEFSYQYDPAADGKISFALAYPWPFAQNQRFYREIKNMYSKNPSLFLERYTVSTTPAKNAVYAILLSSIQHLEVKKRTKISGIRFPNLTGQKKIFILVARVHGFESISSLAMKNAIKFLLADTPQAKMLLDQYLFVIIPMLNPDSVKLGLNRVDSLGVDIQQTITPSHPLKALVDGISSNPRYRGILIIRSSLDKDMLKYTVPAGMPNDTMRHLDLPVQVAAHPSKVHSDKSVNTSTSPLLQYLAAAKKDAMVIEVDIPTMKKSTLLDNQVISTDIETVVNGDTAAQGDLGIRQNTKRIMLGLLKTLTAPDKHTLKIKKAKKKLLKSLMGSQIKPN
jgi:Zinc carboxypeptidase/Cytosolic carboxypeptidase N-terminal domain